MITKEIIPNNALLYMRVHETYFRDNELNLGVFRDHNKGMSTDWDKYSTPKETLGRAVEPKKNGVIQLDVGRVRKIPPLEVEHAPVVENMAHTEVYGKKDTRVRMSLGRIYKWAIPVQNTD